MKIKFDVRDAFYIRKGFPYTIVYVWVAFFSNLIGILSFGTIGLSIETDVLFWLVRKSLKRSQERKERLRKKDTNISHPHL